MPEPTQAEIVREALMPEGTRVPTSPAEVIGRRIRDKANEESWKKGIEEAAKTSPLDNARVAGVIEKIGTERDPDTGAKIRNPQEQARVDNINTAADILRHALEDINSLTPAEIAELESQILGAENSIGFLRDKLRGMTQAQKRQHVRNMLENPQYRQALKNELEQFFTNSENLLKEENILNAQDEVEEKEIERDNALASLRDTEERIRILDAKLAEFAPATNGKPAGAKAAEIDRIKTNLATIQTELKTWKNIARDAEFQLQQLQRREQSILDHGQTGTTEFTNVEGQIDRQRAILENAKEEIQAREPDIEKLHVLEEERNRLEQDKNKEGGLEAERREKEKILNKAKLELRKAQRTLQDLKAVRAGQEEDLVNGIKNAPARAVAKMLNDQLEEMSDVVKAEISKLQTQTASEDEKAIGDAITRRYLGRERQRGIFNRRRYRPVDRSRVNQDIDLLMELGVPPGSGGPRELMRRTLLTAINPRTNTAYTPAEVDALLNNSSFTEKTQPELIKRVLSHGIQMGRIGPEDFYYLSQTDWGKDMITHATQENNDFKSALERELGAGAVQAAGFPERWRRAIRRNPLLILLLLGIPAAMAAKSALASE